VYTRLGLEGIANQNLRITLDKMIRVKLDEAKVELPLIRDNEYLMEIKSDEALPLPLCRKLSELKILSESFSKTKTAYYALLNNTQYKYNGGLNHV
jgi:hypothetical protein